jgi:glutamate dehydrogenase
VSGELQLSLYAEVMALLRMETLWFLRNADVTSGIGGLVERQKNGIDRLRAMLRNTLPEALLERVSRRVVDLSLAGVPEGLAQRIADLSVLSFGSDIVQVSERSGVSVPDAATAFFAVFDMFGLLTVIEQGRALMLPDRFDRMALDRTLANLMRSLRDLTADVLRTGTGPVPERVRVWSEQRRAGLNRTATAVAELTQGELTVSRLSVAAGILADLAQS